MKALIKRLAALATGLMLVSPTLVSAHEGHAGDHGWLAGAAQPLLGVDHFLAGLFVAVVVALGVAGVATSARERGKG